MSNHDLKVGDVVLEFNIIRRFIPSVKSYAHNDLKYKVTRITKSFYVIESEFGIKKIKYNNIFKEIVGYGKDFKADVCYMREGADYE